MLKDGELITTGERPDARRRTSTTWSPHAPAVAMLRRALPLHDAPRRTAAAVGFHATRARIWTNTSINPSGAFPSSLEILVGLDLEAWARWILPRVAVPSLPAPRPHSA